MCLPLGNYKIDLDTMDFFLESGVISKCKFRFLALEFFLNCKLRVDAQPLVQGPSVKSGQ